MTTPARSHRSYQLFRHGGPIRVTSHALDGFTRRKKIHEPIARERIAAVDTESFRDGADPLRTSIVTLALHDRVAALDMRGGVVEWRQSATLEELRTEPLPEGTAPRHLRALEAVLSLMFGEGWGVTYPKESATKQRKRLTREDRARRSSRTGRDGRRLKVPTRVVAFHNLPYDIGRLVPDHENLRRLYAGVSSWRMRVGRYEIEWERYIDKGASQFLWLVRDPEAKRIMRIKGFDTFNYLKTSLHAAALAMGVGEKETVDATDFERDLSSFTREEWTGMLRYASRDTSLPRAIYAVLADMLSSIEPGVVSRDGTIPASAPGSAAAIAWAKAFTLHPERDAWSRLPESYDRMGALAYHGARVFCRRPGVFSGLVALDLKSAYPSVMAMLPDPVTAVASKVGSSRGFDVAEWRGRWGVLFVSGEALDAELPAFPQRSGGRLRWHAGPFENMPVTVPELVIGVARGALRIDRVHGGVVLDGSPERSFLRAFVLGMYAMKEENRDTNPALSLLAKLLLNSLYGKLIQVDGADLSWSSTFPIPEPALQPGPRSRFARSLVTLLANDGRVDEDLLWFGEVDHDEEKQAQLRARFVDARDRERARAAQRGEPTTDGEHSTSEVRATREALLYAQIVRSGYGGTGRLLRLDEFLRDAKAWRAGAYFMPLYAAQITGFVTAAQGAMAACTDAYAGDTDSVFVHCPSGRVEGVQGFADYFEVMARAGYVAPREGGESIAGTTLGRWEVEMPASLESVLARTKRYSHRYEKPLKGEQRGPRALAYKQAHQGIPNVPKPMRGAGLHVLVRRLYENGEASYTTARSPRKGREAAQRGGVVGEFVARDITARNDPMPFTTTGPDGIVRWDRARLRLVPDGSFRVPVFDAAPEDVEAAE